MVALCEPLLKESPHTNEEAWVAISEAYYQLDMTQEAFEAATRASTYSHKNAKVHLIKALIFEERGDLHNTIESYVKVLTYDPDDLSHYDKALMFASFHEYTDAIEVLVAKAQRIFNAKEHPLIMAYIAKINGDDVEAAQLFREHFLKHPNQETLDEVSDLLIHYRNFNIAADLMQEGMRLIPDLSPDIRFKYGMALSRIPERADEGETYLRALYTDHFDEMSPEVQADLLGSLAQFDMDQLDYASASAKVATSLKLQENPEIPPTERLIMVAGKLAEFKPLEAMDLIHGHFEAAVSDAAENAQKNLLGWGVRFAHLESLALEQLGDFEQANAIQRELSANTVDPRQEDIDHFEAKMKPIKETTDAYL